MLQQDQVIEKLSEIATVRGFLAFSTQQISEHIEQLIQRVFRKEDFALKSVVDSLFEHQGPLAELPVRLKLLLGLGVISANTYEDVNAFFQFKLALSDEVEEPTFSSPPVIYFVQQLHCVDLISIPQFSEMKLLNNKDSMQFQMQQIRLEKIIKSSLILGVSEILRSLDVESPI
ncbi:MltR family transcriptional regulator [Canicola haemoglobinophilus]|uniref:Mannitol repressor protein n=1 Tax=Canicola haemoglobinophilus TaxID=733 RepID=A0A1V4B3N8_9PAST|nr:MltR family transcriptional regulator [Canicola haemoglobinophilus]OOS01982.1 MltR family transcriptional regulator [Canicola haemoglobinophilus]STO54128.1 mannitol repressor protein [Canicola haemoglobinophilus]STO60436.1 mannitol repressor protein [Canicola haemoglobinophilus]STO68661.1 mannitol repressor protein [Canicola haemoglobinophilus]